MSDYDDYFMSDVPRGVSTRFLKDALMPQERFQRPADIAGSDARALGRAARLNIAHQHAFGAWRQPETARHV